MQKSSAIIQLIVKQLDRVAEKFEVLLMKTKTIKTPLMMAKTVALRAQKPRMFSLYEKQPLFFRLPEPVFLPRQHVKTL